MMFDTIEYVIKGYLFLTRMSSDRSSFFQNSEKKMVKKDEYP